MLGPDVDLVAPVADTVGVFHPEPCVAPEVGGVGVDDLHSDFVGLHEELAGDIHDRCFAVGVDAVPHEVAEARTVQGVSQLLDETRRGVGRLVGEERADVEDRQGRHVRHGTRRAVCP